MQKIKNKKHIIIAVSFVCFNSFLLGATSPSLENNIQDDETRKILVMDLMDKEEAGEILNQITINSESIEINEEENNNEGVIKEDVNSEDVIDEEDNSKENYILLVNKNNPLSEQFIPNNLINMARKVPSVKSEVLLNAEAVDKYIEMIAAMKLDGVEDIYAVSGYRDFNRQSVLHKNKVASYIKYLSKEEAELKAGMVVAPPGLSEHQTGFALDVSSKSVGFSLEQNFEYTDSYKWLKENSYNYGFIIRYQKEKTDITGIIFEPWHLRYVGAEHAKSITLNDYCFEEYLDSIINVLN